MEPNTNSPASGAGLPLAELIVQNGRLKGTSRPLAAPLTLIGRAAGCEMRLNVEGVGALHCALAHGVDGICLRLLPGGGVTLVNGAPAVDGPLADGDVLTVGPFQFRLHVRGTYAAAAAARVEAAREELRRDLEAEKDALRIQAAAVVAQQVALGEEETRLQQRRAALEQQQEQLSAHLEDKRRRLTELREKLKGEHIALRASRAEHESRVAEAQRELDTIRADAADGREQLRADRQHLIDLRRRLKHRWHRHWAAERGVLKRREEEIASQWSAVAREEERLQRERERLAQDRLSINGEVELGRRHLQAAWDELRRAQQQEAERVAGQRRELADRRSGLDERELLLVDGERGLAAEQHHWQHKRRTLEREAEGLENRIRNFRRKIFDQEQEVRRLEAVLFNLQRQIQDGPAATARPSVEVVPAPVLSVMEPAPAPRIEVPALPLEQLERLSGEVADQRLILAEYCERLAQTQQHWQRLREAAAAEMEAVARRLEEREQDIEVREKQLVVCEGQLRQQQREASHLQHYLEGWQSRMTARESSWQGERDRLLAEVQNREHLTEQRLRAVSQVQQRWTRRRRHEVEWLKSERSACEKLRREFAGLREDWLRRSAELEKHERELAERALALEQLEQESVNHTADASVAERRLEKLRRRWESAGAASVKELNALRDALEGELADLRDGHKHLQKQAARLSALEEELSQKQTQWEQKELLVEDELSRLRSDLTTTHTQRDRYSQQVLELRDEVERLARLLLEEAEPVRLSVVQAA